MPGIPPAPAQTQFEQIAKAIDPNASVISTRKLGDGISCRMDVLEFSIDGEETEVLLGRPSIVISYLDGVPNPAPADATN